MLPLDKAEQDIKQVLMRAYHTHKAENPTCDVFAGANFIECMTCKKHAHVVLHPDVVNGPLLLQVHTAKSYKEIISPNCF